MIHLHICAVCVCVRSLRGRNQLFIGIFLTFVGEAINILFFQMIKNSKFTRTELKLKTMAMIKQPFSPSLSRKAFEFWEINFKENGFTNFSNHFRSIRQQLVIFLDNLRFQFYTNDNKTKSVSWAISVKRLAIRCL